MCRIGGTLSAHQITDNNLFVFLGVFRFQLRALGLHLLCGDGTLYTGWTNDLDRRLAAHNAGRGGKYTRSRLPVTLVYHEEFDTKEEAMAREWAIKQLTRAQKLKLIQKT